MKHDLQKNNRALHYDKVGQRCSYIQPWSFIGNLEKKYKSHNVGKDQNDEEQSLLWHLANILHAEGKQGH